MTKQHEAGDLSASEDLPNKEIDANIRDALQQLVALY